ncbi:MULTISPECIES: penicillin-binding protein 2 [Arthrobacter]|uniref:Penicillin-binding protein 2 n=2 Tax=Arthrobacter TaxID=1663 RepID=A0ABU9KH45_9MICC|nr:penicillin-binding protein 2 [Arthrobacter sp. YJM1]MDP5226208.1 penicillin-binding protein 2 [Arthrobacter sp. YJM1]
MSTGRNNRKGGATRVRKRLRIGLGVMLTLLLVVGGKLILIQGFDIGDLAAKAESLRAKTVTLPAQRGAIEDINGNVLANSIIRYNVVIDPSTNTPADTFERRDPKDPTRVVEVSRDQGLKELAALLKQDFNAVKAAATGTSKYSLLAKGVKPDVADQITALNVPGVVTQGTSQRVYPDGSVAGGIVGYLQDGTTGVGGIEQTQDKLLQGTDGSRSFEMGADGLVIPQAPDKVTAAQNGQTVRLTINRDLQYYAQQVIQTRVKSTGAEYGIAVVAEVGTGNIVAMADSNAPDPNNPGGSAAQDLGVRAVQAAVEPGSVEKTLVAAALVEEGKSTPQEQFHIPNEYTVNGQTFGDSFDHPAFNRTLAGILGYSLNTGTVMAGQRLTKQERYDWLKKFGIGEAPDIPLPGVSQGILTTPDKWDGRQEYTVLFGQGVSQSVLQTVMAYQSIANDGVLLKPRLIDAYIGPDGKVQKTPVTEVRRVLSPETAQKTKDMLESVVTAGEWKDAQIAGYRVGAKTGTSQSPCDNGQAGYCGYTASIVGMAPMDDPKYVVEVLIQRPKTNIMGIDGADLFRDIMGQALRMNNVAPSTGAPVHLDQYGPGGSDGTQK